MTRSRKTSADAKANRSTKRSEKKDEAILEALREGGTVADAAKAAVINRATAYRWREADKKFADAWDDAIEEGTDALEKEAIRRAVEGVREPVIYQGKFSTVTDPNTGEETPLTVRKYSDSLLMFMLKGRRPEKFKDRHEHTGKDGGPIATKEMTRLETARRLAFLLTLGAQSGDGS